MKVIFNRRANIKITGQIDQYNKWVTNFVKPNYVYNKGGTGFS